MKAENPYVKLFKLILPVDIASFFDLVDVREKDGVDDRRELLLYPDEKPVVPAGYDTSDLSSNGFMTPETFKIFRYVTGVSIYTFAVVDGWIIQQAKVCRKTGIWSSGVPATRKSSRLF